MIDALRYQLSPLDTFISVVVLFVFGVSQPLLDLLGRNAEFFLARASPPLDVVLVGLVLAVVIPGVLGLFIVTIGRLHEPTGRVLHRIVLTLLGGMLALQIIERTSLRRANDLLEIVLAMMVGLIITVAIRRSPGFQSMMRFGVVAPVLALAVFLFLSPASQLIFRSGAINEPAAISVGNPAPVVFIIFDEFPLASLIDGEGTLQEEVYPNFARLAKDGTWYRNAITVQQQTEEAIPAILTGNDPPPDRLPMAFDYPANLFTLLSDHYEIRAREQVTELCPEYACENRSRPQVPFAQRWQTLISDIWIVAAHVFLPNDLRSGLPPIDHSWSNFETGLSEEEETDFNIIRRFNEAVSEDRRIPFQEFLDAIEPPDEEPTLDFIHVMLPHIPWQYVSTGQKFYAAAPIPGSATTGWGDDEWLVNQGYQRHLMQVQYADTMIGQLIDRLEAIDTYDEALIVVLADHGVIVRPNIKHRRVALEDTVGEIAAIPLFIKEPYQESGRIDDYRAETIDILPTVVDVLGIELPWETDGSSLLAADRPDRTESQITGSQGAVVFGTDGTEKLEIAGRKIDDFGMDGPFGLTPLGQRNLLGLAIDPATVAISTTLTASIENPGRYNVVRTAGDSLPLHFNGSLVSAEQLSGESVLAVGLNGEIVAVTRTYDTNGRTASFYAMIPPDKLIDGVNEVSLFLVGGANGSQTLEQIPTT